MVKDIIGSMIILIFLFLILKDSKASSSVIDAIANQTASTVSVLQGRTTVGGPGTSSVAR
jgi:hypothetical protein